MKEYKIEILLYLKTLTDFLNKNINVKEYFLVDETPDYFFTLVKELSEENLNNRGEPSLTTEQFETIREKMRKKKSDRLLNELKHFNIFFFKLINMNRKIPFDYKLYDGSYNDEIPKNEIFVLKFDELPSYYRENKYFYNDKVLYYLKEYGFDVLMEHKFNDKTVRNHIEILLCDNKKRMLILIKSLNSQTEPTYKIEFLYDISRGEFNEQFNIKSLDKFIKKSKESNINLVKSEMGYLDTEEYNIKIPKIDLTLNYGKEFLKKHNTIIQRLNTQDDTGIILLHGDPGTGKTTYLKYLTTLVKNKEILFIPPSMAEMLAEPSIIPFLMGKQNSILIIEDGERVIGDRETTGSPIAVSNILNLTDGILGDCLKIQIIVTFNMKKERIDKALLRKGRLIAEHKFEKLSIENSNLLFKHLKKNQTTDIPMSLADIYHFDTEDMSVTKEYNKVGFK